MVDNTDTKQQMLKEPFKFLQGKFSGWGCLFQAWKQSESIKLKKMLCHGYVAE